MVKNIAENDIGKRVDNFGDQHHDANTAYRQSYLIRIEVSHLPDEIRHKSESKLSAEVRYIIDASHHHYIAVLIRTP